MRQPRLWLGVPQSPPRSIAFHEPTAAWQRYSLEIFWILDFGLMMKIQNPKSKIQNRMNICMLTSSYPKYPGETTAPFIEEIAAGLARRGHTIHVVAPFHRDIRRAPVERGVHLHFFRYSPVRALNVWGYAEALRADVGLRGRVLAAAPLALSATILEMLRLTATARQGDKETRRQGGEEITRNDQLVSLSPGLPVSL